MVHARNASMSLHVVGVVFALGDLSLGDNLGTLGPLQSVGVWRDVDDLGLCSNSHGSDNGGLGLLLDRAGYSRGGSRGRGGGSRSGSRSRS